MDFKKLLSEEPSWETEFYNAYKVEDEQKNTKTAFHFQIPFAPEKEALVFEKHQIRPEQRKEFYQRLLVCVQHHLSTTRYLERLAVPSILTFSQVVQERIDGASHIFLVTDNVQPILSGLFSPSVTILTAMEATQRIASIMRDISKVGVTHRGFTLEEVFLNADNKILLGGFYYASCPGVEKYTDYLPNRPINLSPALLAGDPGHQGTDMQCLAMTAWNLFSGLSHDAAFTDYRLVLPRFATPDMANALQLALMGKEENCNAFRRKFTDARKAISKTEFAATLIPYRGKAKRAYRIDYVPIPEPPGGNKLHRREVKQ